MFYRQERINKLINQQEIKVASTASSLPVDIVGYLAMPLYFAINKISKNLNIAYSSALQHAGKMEKHHRLIKRLSLWQN